MKTSFTIILLVFAIYANAQNVTQDQYLEKATYIWKNFVPESGQAIYVHGELLRAIEKLRDEAQRNGNINFHDKCHVELIQFLNEKLMDKKLFNSVQRKQIKVDLKTLNNSRQPYLEDDIYDRISDRIVDWFLFYGEDVVHTKNVDLQC